MPRRSPRTPGLPHQDRREYSVPDTPEARQHAEDAETLREELRDFGVAPEMVAPTRDNTGYVRLNFAQVNKLLDRIYDLEEDVDELKLQLPEPAATSNDA